MLRKKIDKFGYEYFGRQYLYLNVLGDIISYLKSSIIEFTKEQMKERNVGLEDHTESFWRKNSSEHYYSDQHQ